MSRLNLTLDEDTFSRISQHAKARHARVATVARSLLREALEQRERVERAKKLARDYAQGRADARELLADWEPLSLELLGDEHD